MSNGPEAYRWDVEYWDRQQSRPVIHTITAPTASDAITMANLIVGKERDEAGPMQTLSAVRLAQPETIKRGRPAKPSNGVWPERFAAIEKLLREGRTQHYIKSTLGTNQQQVRKVCDEIGWNTAWRKLGFRRKPVGSLQRQEAVRLYCEEKMTLEAIGAIAGVTRERIRQVLEEEGVSVAEVYRERLDDSKAERAEIEEPERIKIEQRKQEREQRWVAMKEDWERTMDEPIMETCRRYAVELNSKPFAVLRLIYYLRKQRGWFPERVSMIEPLPIDLEAAERLWREDKSLVAMASELGVSPKQLHSWIQNQRGRHGRFPARSAHRSREITFGPARAMWDEGLSVAEIARRLNKSYHTTHEAITILRLRKGWFPARQSVPKPESMPASA